MNHRDPLFAGLLALCALSSTPAFAQKSTMHCLQPGSANVDIGRYTTYSTGTNGGYYTLGLPLPGNAFLFKVTQTVCPSTTNAWTLQPDGTFLINQTGLYRFSMNIDQPAQGGAKRGSKNPNGFDVDMRSREIGYLPPGAQITGVAVGGQLNVQHSVYSRLAADDIPGADSPTVSRGSVAFPAQTLTAGYGVHYDIPLPDTGYIQPGDYAVASLTSLTDAAGPENNDAVAVTAKVIGPDLIRVYVEVVRNQAIATLPAGTLNAMAFASTTSRGQSKDAWRTTNSPLVLMKAGETVFFTWESHVPNDYAQVDDMTWVQLEYYGPAGIAGSAVARR